MTVKKYKYILNYGIAKEFNLLIVPATLTANVNEWTQKLLTEIALMFVTQFADDNKKVEAVISVFSEDNMVCKETLELDCGPKSLNEVRESIEELILKIKEKLIADVVSSIEFRSMKILNMATREVPQKKLSLLFLFIKERNTEYEH